MLLFHVIFTRPYIKNVRHGLRDQNVCNCYICIEHFGCQPIIVSKILMYEKYK